ncbi:hypothetical protein GUJ93_ZPchr0013g35223 [Zizania palustris]|uniref:Uncharacterized protein n=1 Tax=Zizania palustris TaxID=103762 RepID=A0A8J5X687_ZIZPA|nr:hypothetical protein GUJ93_ZPchr0013g35223 [Zizania palustris]
MSSGRGNRIREGGCEHRRTVAALPLTSHRALGIGRRGGATDTSGAGKVTQDRVRIRMRGSRALEASEPREGQAQGWRRGGGGGGGGGGWWWLRWWGMRLAGGAPSSGVASASRLATQNVVRPPLPGPSAPAT